MKNFRKVLALILVVATLFSFVAMASAKTAADYSDAADIKYVEAVDVLSAIGITEGYNGAFHANDPIDRDEVAAMVARLRNGGTVDAALYVGADNVFADVKGQWSEGYVTYCAQLGIIDGYNATTFAPDASVKGVEVLKMLLCVLGYDADEQGYVGANWQVNVVRDAAKSGLLIDGVDVYAAATRDEVAQYFLNALKAKMVVGYIGEGLVKLTNSIWVDLKDDAWQLLDIITPDSVGKDFEVTYCNAVIAGTELWESIPGLKLDKTETYDCYARPAYSWKLVKDGKTILNKVYTKAPYFAAADLSASEVQAKLNALTQGDSKIWEAKNNYKDFDVYVDGVEGSWATVKLGNGVLVEAYADRIVVINTYIGKVGTVSARANMFEILAADKTQLHKFELNDYEVATGDMVLYYLCNGKCVDNECTGGRHEDWLHDVTVIEPVVASVSEGDNYGHFDYADSSYIVADGKTYYYNALMADYYADFNTLHAMDVAVSDKYDIYLDAYGNIKYAELHTEKTEYKYAYIVEGTATARIDGIVADNMSGILGEALGFDGDLPYLPVDPDLGVSIADSYDASLVKFGADGALDVAKKEAVDMNSFVLMAAQNAANLKDKDEDMVGALVKYSVDAKGNFVTAERAAFAQKNAKLDAESYVIGTGADGKGVYCTSETVFMIRTMNLDGTYSYEQVTGYKNLEGTYIAEDVTSTGSWLHAYLPDHVKPLTNATNIQYFVDADHPAFASYVFIDAKYQDADLEHFMVLGKVKYERFETVLKNVYGADYDVYDALVDGERAIIAADKAIIGGGILEAGVLYTDVIEFRGFTTTIGGAKVPLYVMAKEDKTEFNLTTVDCVNEIQIDETYIRYNGDTVKLLAKDVKMYTISVVPNYTTGRYELSVTNDLVTSAELALTGEKISKGYVVLNAAKTEVVEIYAWLAPVSGTVPTVGSWIG